MSPVSYCTYTVTLAFTKVAIDLGLIPKTSSCYVVWGGGVLALILLWV